MISVFRSETFVYNYNIGTRGGCRTSRPLEVDGHGSGGRSKRQLTAAAGHGSGGCRVSYVRPHQVVVADPLSPLTLTLMAG
jgi:hypothetical protein